MKAKVVHVIERCSETPDSSRRVVVALCFLAIIASLALPYVQLTSFVRTDTFTGIELATFQEPSPRMVPPDDFKRKWEISYETAMASGDWNVVRDPYDAQLSEELGGDRLVAILVLALAVAGLAGALAARPRLVVATAGGGVAILVLGMMEAANPLAILDTPPSGDHLAGWWLAFWLFVSALLAERLGFIGASASLGRT